MLDDVSRAALLAYIRPPIIRTTLHFASILFTPAQFQLQHGRFYAHHHYDYRAVARFHAIYATNGRRDKRAKMSHTDYPARQMPPSHNGIAVFAGLRAYPH